MATIYRDINANSYVRPNFQMHELRSGSTDAPETFELDDTVLDALQFVRDNFGTTDVNSTGRTTAHNKKIGSGTWSRHWITESRPVDAIDFKIADQEQEKIFQKDIQEKGFFFNQLRSKYGVTIGIYDSFTAHIDTAGGQGVSAANVFNDHFGQYGYWSKKKAKL